jgi:hypothetical protein
MPLLDSPFKEYDGRRTLRSLADALEKLHEVGSLFDGEHVQIKTQGMPLPDRQTGIVAIVGPQRPDGSVWIVWMPPAAKFTAAVTSARQVHPIDVLNGAVSDREGNVETVDGKYFHGINFIPTPFPPEFTKTQHAIVELATEFLGADDRCYRPIHEELMPEIGFLDFSQVPKVQIQKLKALKHFILRRIPEASPYEIVSALRQSGMRFPRQQP